MVSVVLPLETLKSFEGRKGQSCDIRTEWRLH